MHAENLQWLFFHWHLCVGLKLCFKYFWLESWFAFYLVRCTPRRMAPLLSSPGDSPRAKTHTVRSEYRCLRSGCTIMQEWVCRSLFTALIPRLVIEARIGLNHRVYTLVREWVAIFLLKTCGCWMLPKMRRSIFVVFQCIRFLLRYLGNHFEPQPPKRTLNERLGIWKFVHCFCRKEWIVQQQRKTVLVYYKP